VPVIEQWAANNITWYGNNGSGPNPTLGNGILNARSRRYSGEFQFQLYLQIGSTTVVAGSGGWIFGGIGSGTIDTTAGIFAGGATGNSAGAQGPVVDAFAWQHSTGNAWRGSARLSADPGASIVTQVSPPSLFLDAYFADGASTRCGAASPFVWATGDWLYIGNTIEDIDS
jgi:hypothetical protein